MSFDTPIPPYSASDPYSTFLNASCFEHLLIELVPLAERMARRFEDTQSTDGGPVRGATGHALAVTTATTGGSTTGTALSAEKEREDEIVREAMFFRLDSLGYRVGQGLAER